MANETDYKTTIKIEGDSAGAQGAIGRTASALKGLLAPLTAIRNALGAVMRATGVFYLAAEGVRLVVNAYKSLHDWLGRAATAAKELQRRLAQEGAQLAVERAVEAYKRLNKEIEEANRLERERNAILDARKSTERDLEDASAERDKQLAISKLDPASATYADDKAAIERRFARLASETALARAREDNGASANRLYAEADRKDREADRMQKVYERQLGANDRLVEIRWRTGMEARGGDEEAKRRADDADKQWRQSLDEVLRTKEAMEALRKEADSLRVRAGELTGGARAAVLRNEASQLSIDNQERESAARKEQEAKREAERAAEAARREAERKEQEAKREAERQAEADRRAKEREIGEQIRATGAVASGLVSVAPSASRLNAMGLGAGSGVQRVQEQMAKSLADLVRLGNAQLVALKDISGEEGGATFQ